MVVLRLLQQQQQLLTVEVIFFFPAWSEGSEITARSCSSFAIVSDAPTTGGRGLPACERGSWCEALISHHKSARPGPGFHQMFSVGVGQQVV